MEADRTALLTKEIPSESHKSWQPSGRNQILMLKTKQGPGLF